MGRAYFGELCQVNLAVLPRADDKSLMEEHKSSKHEKSTKQEAINSKKPGDAGDMLKLEEKSSAATAGEEKTMCDLMWHK
jgi:hypothetical protein